MKANELRIGNLHYYHIVDKVDEREEWDEISKIDIGDLYHLNLNPDDKNYNPIPLTPELLEKCGLKKYDGYGYKVAQGYIIKHANGYFYHYHDLRIRVDYLHQLQNLVFALTGKEIEINF